MEGSYKIAMVSSKNIRDRNTLSGSSFYILAALREYIGEVVIIDQLKPARHSFISIIRFFDFYWRFVLVTARQLWGQMTSRNYRWERTPLISKYYAKMIKKRIKGQPYDFILTDKGAIEVAYLKTDIPILYLADATFKLMIDAYNDYTDVSAFEFSALGGSAKKNGHLLEYKAISNSYRCLYYSNWAAQSAMKHYGADPEKVTVIGQGPYLGLLPDSPADEMREAPPGNECHLLLVGVDWERKGCNIAVDALTALRGMGIEAYLNICGCEAPSKKRLPSHVNVIPFLDKSRNRDLENLVRLYERATYFIFPTRAECFGVVLLEALFFGVPVLATNVGGVSDIVKNGTNGFLFSLEDTGARYAEKIAANFFDPEAYSILQKNSYRFIKEEMNWESWARKLKEAVRPEASIQ